MGTVKQVLIQQGYARIFIEPCGHSYPVTWPYPHERDDVDCLICARYGRRASDQVFGTIRPAEATTVHDAPKAGVTPIVRLRTRDHPSANGRQPAKGERAWTFAFPLEDGRRLLVEVGEVGRAALERVLIAEMLERDCGARDATDDR